MDASASQGHPASRRRPILTAAGVLVAVALVMLGLDRVADFAARRWALAQVEASAATAAALRVAVLRSEIEKQRSLPFALAQDPDVRRALETGNAARIAALNRRFEALAAGARTGVIYLIDADGHTVAASNYRTPESFLGSDYGFRPYFRLALAEGRAEHFAFGTVSRRPGLYLAQRVEADGAPLGVLVLKAEFDALEDEWRRFAEPTFVTDTRHIVLISSVPAFRFRTTVPLDQVEREAIRESLQFGDAPLDLIDLDPSPSDPSVKRLRLPGPASGQASSQATSSQASAQTSAQGGGPAGGPQAKREDFLEASLPVPTTDWTLSVLAPTAGTTNLAATAARASAALLGVVGIGSASLWRTRRRRRARAEAREAEARRELEARVADRTAELSAANAQLRTEMEERRRARLAIDALQDELVQASKLAVLGQIAAGVAHEVNQPVAAIRTFAENSRAFLAQGQPGPAVENLETIAALTERIGAITGELRAFARKSAARLEPVELGTVVDGALLLLRYRLLQNDITLSVALDLPEAKVTGDRVRLEQVFVNLIQNAAEALDGRRDGDIRITSSTGPDTVEVTVADNGPGLPPEVLGALFLPFTTTKPQGLGLGLVISKDIITESGGTLTVANAGGAVFTITLPRAACGSQI
ncbi:sensor histidine kinase [Xanthobacter autotrophicus]|uniref:sensor histidine kinase n=1 Tax=Xanthobacter TaxID=279 RepID=UPI0024AC0204|nr:ATP-binding protein [Xanthobacter autotrophicus]MDI4665688.1 sensor histidine kinase [Xanthobacter autotrophicus]